MNRFPQTLAVSMTLLAAACAATADEGWPSYHAYDVSGSARQCHVRDINASGQITGTARFQRQEATAGFLTGPNGSSLQRIGQGSEAYTWVGALNDAGVVVGYVRRGAEDPLTNFVYDAAGGLRTLALPGGTDDSIFHDINNQGQIVGRQVMADGFATRAVRVQMDGSGYTQLGTLGGDVSEAFLISDAGVMAGRSSREEGGVEYAFVQAPGSNAMRAVGDRAMTRDPRLWFSLTTLAPNGQVMGEVQQTPRGRYNGQTYLASRAGHIQQMVSWKLPPGSSSTGVHMTSLTEEQWFAGYRDHQTHRGSVIDSAVLGKATGETRDLIDLVVNRTPDLLLHWGRINARGQLAVQGSNAAGKSRCILLCRHEGCAPY